MHRLLKRQLKKAGIRMEDLPAAGLDLLEHIDRTYVESDRERYTLERSLMLSSDEMQSLYHDLEQRSESALHKERAMLRSLINSIPFQISIMDDEGRYLACNRAFEAHVGLSEHELAGKTNQALFGGDGSALANLLPEPGSPVTELCRSEHTVIGRDGHDIVLEITRSPLWDIDGRPRGILRIARDITQEKRIDDQLRQAAIFFDSANESIMIANARSEIVAVNSAFTRLLGYSEEEVVGRNPRILQSGRHDKQFYQEMWRTIVDEGTWSGQVWNRRKKGDVIPGWLTISSVKDEQGAITHYVAVFADISEVIRTQDKLDHLAHHDLLTGLPNRLQFNEYLEFSLLTAERERTQCALLFLDLDRFKNINDTLGHPTGDQVLKIMARRLTRILRESDKVARLGGDEYVVTLNRIVHPDDAALVAKKILHAIAKPFSTGEHEISITASIGISIFPRDAQDSVTLLKHADIAMYRAKEHGKNNYQFYSPEMTTLAFAHLSLESNLRRALVENGFLLHYQPQVSIDENRVIGAEALIRWQRTNGELLLPGEFISLAEDTGLIIPMGDWVLKEACRQHMAWRREEQMELTVSVNVSVRQITHPRFVSHVRSVLKDSGIRPGQLKLEITEHALMDSAENIVRILGELKKLGILLSIDDFGTGYSSMSYLKRFSLEEMKIDRSFIRDIPEDANDNAIARAIIALGHSLGMSIIAEGVETNSQLEFLRAEKCNRVQGYLVSPPLPAGEFQAFLRTHKAAGLSLRGRRDR